MTDVTPWVRAREALRDRNSSELDALEAELGTLKESASFLNALRAQVALGREDLDAARRLLIGASRKRPLDPHEKLMLGLVIDDPKKATKLLHDAEKAGLDDPRIPEGLGVAAARAGQLDEAVELFQKAAKLDPKSWSAQYALATAFMERGDFADAGEAYETTAKLRPDFEPAWLGLADAGMRCGQAAKVSRILGRVAQMAPDRQNLHIAYARCLMQGGDLRKAVAVLTPWARASDDVRLLFDYVELCMRAGFVDSARAALARVAKLDQKEPRLWLYRGLIAERSEPQDVPAALAAYEKALELDPNNTTARNALALLLMRPTDHEDHDRADALLTEASRDTSPNGWAALSNLALLRRQQERAQEAVELAKRVVAQAAPRSGAYVQAEKLIAELA